MAVQNIAFKKGDRILMKQYDKKSTDNLVGNSDTEWMPLDKDAHYHGKRVDSRHTIVRTSTGNDTLVLLFR